MATRRINPELAQQAVDAVATTGTETAAALLLGLPRTTLQARVAAAARLGLKAKVEHKDSPRLLKDRIRRLELELKAQDRAGTAEDIVKSVIGELAARVEDVEPPAWTGRVDKVHSSPGVPTLFLSDLHWGEVVHPSQINGVNKYNLSTARSRLERCVRSAEKLLRIISPKLDYPGVVLSLGGDLISGNIHDELTATNELNTMPTVLDLYGELVKVVAYLADTFGAVFVPCVSGNHGRDTQKIWGKDRHATSFDWLICRFLAKHFDTDKRVTFLIPDGPDAYYKIYNHRYLLTHGDQFRGGDGMIGALGPIIRGDHKKRSRNAQIDMEYDTMCIGHWHQYVHLTRLIVNGSLKGYDEYAYSNNFGFEEPQQALWLTHPDKGITFRMPVYVGESGKRPKSQWVEVPR